MAQKPSVPDACGSGAYNSAIKRARSLIGVHKWNSALQEVHNALAANPDSEYAHYLAALCHYWLKNDKAVQTEAQKAVELDPEYSYGYWLLACVAHRQRRYLRGLKLIKSAIELNQEEPDFYACRALLLLGIGKLDQSLKDTEEALQINPEHELALATRTIVLSHLGRHDEADQQSLELLRKSSDSSLAWYQRGVQLFNDGKAEEARQAQLEALRLNPENKQAEKELMKAITAKRGFFSLLWRWTFFLNRLPRNMRVILPLTLLLSIRLFVIISDRYTVLRPLTFLLVAHWWILVIYIYSARALFRCAVRKGWIK